MALSDALLELQQLTERLRRDCPWDREQTVRTIVPHTVEEAYEVADAALAGDREKLLDVFGDVEARTAGRVRENWERIKSEQEGREGIFHHVPAGLPALLYARKIQHRAAAVGFEYPDTAGALADLDDELRELKEGIDEGGGGGPGAGGPARDDELCERKEAIEGGGEVAPETEPDAHVVEEVGDVLFAAVNVARRLNVDPELALRSISDRFVERVEQAERLASEEGKRFAELELEQ